MQCSTRMPCGQRYCHGYCSTPRWEYTKATRNGEQLTLRRCAECWTRRDAYPHQDNGYQPADQPYEHAPDCKAGGQS
jgi:hypothetical protein